MSASFLSGELSARLKHSPSKCDATYGNKRSVIHEAVKQLMLDPPIDIDIK